jgi:hypothetical protein
MTALLPTRTPSEITSILAQILAQSAHAVINHPGEYRQMRRTKTPLANMMPPVKRTRRIDRLGTLRRLPLQ